MRMDYAPRSSLKKGVALANDDLMIGQWGIKFSALQVQRALKDWCLSLAPRITSPAEMTPLPNYMYFQKMKTHIHALQQGRDVSIKNKAHPPMDGLGLILYEVSVLPSFWYAYAMTNLSITLHGIETISNKH